MPRNNVLFGSCVTFVTLLLRGSKPKKVDFQLLMIPCLCGTVLAHVSFSKHWESVRFLEKTMLDASLKFKSFFIFASRFYSKSEVCKKSKKQIIKIWCWLLVKIFFTLKNLKTENSKQYFNLFFIFYFLWSFKFLLDQTRGCYLMCSLMTFLFVYLFLVQLVGFWWQNEGRMREILIFLDIFSVYITRFIKNLNGHLFLLWTLY